MNQPVQIPKAKNSMNPLLAIPALAKGNYVFRNVDLFSDLESQLFILKQLNISCRFESKNLYIDSTNVRVPDDVTLEPSSDCRGIVFFMGSLTKYNKKIFFKKPGGCKIGDRKLNYHFDFFEKIGILSKETEDLYCIDSRSKNYSGDLNYVFENITIAGTINAILASVNTSHNITLKNIATDPYILDIINILNQVGFKIEIDLINREITISPATINESKIVDYTAIDDPIVAGTYIILNLIFNKNYPIEIDKISNLGSFIQCLEDIGVSYQEIEDNVFLFKKDRESPENYKIITSEFPEFYTDLHPLFLCLCKHYKIELEIVENIMSDRFVYAPELEKMGYNFSYINNRHVIFKNFVKPNTIPKKITLTDLRGGFAIFLEICKNNLLSKVEVINRNILSRGYNMKDVFDLYFN
jgi:UDP-N-acetylglucosamine 1-carboxyvinyltransferase